MHAVAAAEEPKRGREGTQAAFVVLGCAEVPAIAILSSAGSDRGQTQLNVRQSVILTERCPSG